MPDNRTRVPVSFITLEYFGKPGSTKSQLEIRRFNPSQNVWQQANDALHQWAEYTSLNPDCTHRVEYSITYVDGYCFKSCYLIANHHFTNSELSPDLSRHVQECAETFAGMRRPSHLTDHDYSIFLHALGRTSREVYMEFLTSYEICSCEEFDSTPVEVMQPLPCFPVTDCSDTITSHLSDVSRN
jgi:hypothetical protein